MGIEPCAEGQRAEPCRVGQSPATPGGEPGKRGRLELERALQIEPIASKAIAVARAAEAQRTAKVQLCRCRQQRNLERTLAALKEAPWRCKPQRKRNRLATPAGAPPHLERRVGPGPCQLEIDSLEPLTPARALIVISERAIDDADLAETKPRKGPRRGANALRLRDAVMRAAAVLDELLQFGRELASGRRRPGTCRAVEAPAGVAIAIDHQAELRPDKHKTGNLDLTLEQRNEGDLNLELLAFEKGALGHAGRSGKCHVLEHDTKRWKKRQRGAACNHQVAPRPRLDLGNETVADIVGGRGDEKEGRRHKHKANEAQERIEKRAHDQKTPADRVALVFRVVSLLGQCPHSRNRRHVLSVPAQRARLASAPPMHATRAPGALPRQCAPRPLTGLSRYG